MYRFLKNILILITFFIGCVLSLIIPKRRKLVTFLCNEAGLFGGNIAPLYQAASKASPNLDLRVLSSKVETISHLDRSGVNSLMYPSFRAIWTLLRSKLVITECGLRIEQCGFCAFSNVVQLWHGANLKYMVKDLFIRSDLKWGITTFIYWLKINIPKYAFILSTSEFYKKNTFSTSFNSKEVFIAGYPRNDIFYKVENSEDKWGVSGSIVDRAKNHLEKGYKVIVYCPTWRDKASDDDGVIPFDEKKLITYLEKHNHLLIVKKHHRDPRKIVSAPNDRIIIYPHDKDIYLLLKYSSALITDYSSIFFDYLLLNKPVIFYAYDYDQYIKRDRNLQYDYDEFTPGKKCRNEDELYEEIEYSLINPDHFAAERKAVSLKVFDDVSRGESSLAIWKKCLQVIG